jgi:hypothetical protein
MAAPQEVMPMARTMKKAPFKSIEEEREYWVTADLTAAATEAEKRSSMMITTLYLGREQHAAMNSLARLMHEKAASLYRRAILEFIRREAKKAGTTMEALAGQKE